MAAKQNIQCTTQLTIKTYHLSFTICLRKPACGTCERVCPLRVVSTNWRPSEENTYYQPTVENAFVTVHTVTSSNVFCKQV